MSASGKPTPWNLPIGWPNCCRSAAHDVDISSTRWARPTLLAATVSRLAPSHSPISSKPLALLAQQCVGGHADALERELELVVAPVGDVDGSPRAR